MILKLEKKKDKAIYKFKLINKIIFDSIHTDKDRAYSLWFWFNKCKFFYDFIAVLIDKQIKSI